MVLLEASEAVMEVKNIAEALGVEQEKIAIHCDNQVATGIANDTAKEKRTRHMDMRFQWVREKVYRHVFEIKWRPGKTNLADFTKLLGRYDFEMWRDKT